MTATDAEVAALLRRAHRTTSRIPEKRKIRYLLVDVEALRAKVVVPPADIERAYNDNIEQYSTPEQVRASHILLKTEGKDEAAVKAQAEDVLKQAQGGADFAALATKYSEDEANAKNGGDLDFFGRGRMVPEFDRPRSRWSRADQRSGEDRSTATTSSSWSTRRPARRARSTRSGSSSPISSRSSGRRRRPPTLARDARERRSRSRPISTRPPRRRA